jgi:hypothetical protein
MRYSKDDGQKVTWPNAFLTISALNPLSEWTALESAKAGADIESKTTSDPV